MDDVGVVAVSATVALLSILIVKELGILTIITIVIIGSLSFYLLSLDPALSRYRFVPSVAALYVLRYRQRLRKYDREFPRYLFVVAGYMYGTALRGLAFARNAFKTGISAARGDK